MATKQELMQQRPKMGFSVYMSQDAVKRKIDSVVGGKNGQRFITAIVSAVSNNEMLKQCDNNTIFASALIGESLGLSPSPQLKQYFIVPFNDKNRGMIAQFQLGYVGYIQLAIRSGYYKRINVLEIKEGELVKKFNPLTEEIEIEIIEDENEREKAKTIGYYACYEYKNGFTKAIYWSREKMEAHALKYSQAYRTDVNKGYKYSFWSKDFDAMGKKTMIRQLISKWGIMSVDMQTAFENDMAVINDDGSKEYVDNKEDRNVIDITPVKEEKIDSTNDGQISIDDL